MTFSKFSKFEDRNLTRSEPVADRDDRIAIAIAVTYKFDDKGSGFSWQTTVPQMATDRAISDVVDKIHKAVGRQIGWSRVHTIDSHLHLLLTQRAQLEYDIKSTEANNPEMDKVSRDTRTAYNTNRENFMRHNTLIDGFKREKAELLTAFGVRE
jgi:hypothetical protein